MWNAPSRTSSASARPLLPLPPSTRREADWPWVTGPSSFARTAGSGRGAVFHHYGIQITDPAHSSADQLYFASHSLLVDMGWTALEMPEATLAAAHSALDRIQSARRILDIAEAAANQRLAELEPKGPLT